MENRKELQLKEQSTGLIATLSNHETAREFERSLTVEKIINNAIPVKEVIRLSSYRQVAQALDIVLTKLVSSLNLSQNLNDGQIKTIVEDLLDKYPSESIEDFVLCFKNARQNAYGTIYNLHSAVIFSWMEFYLSEKYDALERKLMREKDIVHQRQEMTSDDIAGKYINQMLENLKPTQKVKSITDQEIRQEGQEKPKRMPYPSTPESLYRQKELHDEWIKECHDPYTGQRNANWIEETEWLKLRL